jgi:hypothetical protein
MWAVVVLAILGASLFGVSNASADDCALLGGVFTSGECRIQSLVTVTGGTFNIATPMRIINTGRLVVAPTVPPTATASLTLNVTGDFTIDRPNTANGVAISGTAVRSVAQGGPTSNPGGIGATITVLATGNILLDGNNTLISAQIASSSDLTSCTTGKGGNISLTSLAGNVTIKGGAKVVSSGRCPGGEISVTAPDGNIEVSGSLISEAATSLTPTLAATRGGPITVDAAGTLLIGPTGSVSSRGVDYGADRVHLESGGDMTILGRAESAGGTLFDSVTPNRCVGTARQGKPSSSTACVEAWVGGKLTVDSTGTNAAFVTASSGAVNQANAACCTWIDLFAMGDVTINGRSSLDGGLPWTVIASQSSPNAQGGNITALSIKGKVNLSGRTFLLDGAADQGGTGGTLIIEAAGPTFYDPLAGLHPADTASNVNLGDSLNFARGAQAPPGGAGQIRTRSYNGQITGGPPTFTGNALQGTVDAGGFGSNQLIINLCEGWLYQGVIVPAVGNPAPVCGGGPTLPSDVIMPTFQKKPTIVVNGGVFPFDGDPHPATGAAYSDPTLTVVLSPALTYTYVDSNGTPLPAGTAPVAIGTYTATGFFAGNAEYRATTATATIQITPAGLPVPLLNVTGGVFTYDGQPHLAIASLVDLLGNVIGTPTIYYNCTVVTSPTCTTTPPVNAGTYDVLAHFPGNILYAGVSATATIIINKAQPVTTVPDRTCVYNSNPCATAATTRGINNVVLTPTVLTYSTTAEDAGIPPGAGGAPRNLIGSYAATGTFAGNANYLPSTGTGTVTITPATPEIVVAGGSFPYDGQPHPGSSSIDGVGGENISAGLTITYYPINPAAPPTQCPPASGTPSTTPPTTMGTYIVVGTYTPGTTLPTMNYLPTVACSPIDIALVIAPRPSVTTATSLTLTYDALPHPSVTTVADFESSPTFPVTPSLLVVTYNGGSTVPLNVGTYAVQANYPGDPFHQASSAQAQIIINPATPTFTLTGGSFTFDNQPHPATSSPVLGVNGQVLAPPVITYCPGTVSSCPSPTATPPTAAGTYTAIAVAGGGNYVVVTRTATITIVSVTAQVNPTGGTFTYDALPHPATATVTDATTQQPIAGATVTFTYNGASTVPVDIGTYNVVATFSGNASYPSVSNTTVIVILPRTPVITLTGGTFTYDAEPHPAVGNVTGLGGVSLGTPTITYKDSSNNSVAVPVQIGTYTATATFAAVGNYSAAAPVTAQIVIQEAATEPCLIVDFREITYFKNSTVITSSDAGIRSRNGISGLFKPSLWPYSASGGSNKTISRGTLFRIYGFKAEELGVGIPDVDVEGKTYPVVEDTEIPGDGRYYIELNEPGGLVGGHPARVFICPSQLQTNLIDQGLPGTGGTPADEGILPDTEALTSSTQKNVPGIMLTRNASALTIPSPVRTELAQLGMPLENPVGTPVTRGAIDYIGLQLWGGGDDDFREFVDIQVTFTDDSQTDRVQHYTMGFHTVRNINFDGSTASSCDYLDWDVGNDTIRYNDVWEGTNVGSPNWGPACGSREPSGNQKKRENYAVPFGAVQLLPTVNTANDTARLFYGAIRPLPVAAPAVFTTYTQGGWGSSPSGNNPGALLKAKFATLYPGGSVQIGGYKRLTFTSAYAIEKFLPQGGSAGVLTSNATNPTTSSAGVLAGQVLALRLSVDFSNAGITRAGLANLKLVSGELAGYTVAQVLSLANTVIGGNTGALPSGLSKSELNSIVDKINNNFDNGTTNNGFLR